MLLPTGILIFLKGSTSIIFFVWKILVYYVVLVFHRHIMLYFPPLNLAPSDLCYYTFRF